MADDDKNDVSSSTSAGQGGDGGAGKKPTETAEPRARPRPPIFDRGGTTMKWEVPNFNKKSDSKD
jgi:hypothetical protein